MMRRLIIIFCVGMLSLIGAAVEAATPFERGLQAESELRIDEARDLFREALAENPDTPGVAEHTAQKRCQPPNLGNIGKVLAYTPIFGGWHLFLAPFFRPPFSCQPKRAVLKRA